MGAISDREMTPRDSRSSPFRQFIRPISACLRLVAQCVLSGNDRRIRIDRRKPVQQRILRLALEILIEEGRNVVADRRHGSVWPHGTGLDCTFGQPNRVCRRRVLAALKIHRDGGRGQFTVRVRETVRVVEPDAPEVLPLSVNV